MDRLTASDPNATMTENLGTEGQMSKHYVVVLAPQRGGCWRAHFPDFTGCHAEGSLVNEAIDQLRSSKKLIPSPRSYEDAR